MSFVDDTAKAICKIIGRELSSNSIFHLYNKEFNLEKIMNSSNKVYIQPVSRKDYLNYIREASLDYQNIDLHLFLLGLLNYGGYESRNTIIVNNYTEFVLEKINFRWKEVKVSDIIGVFS